MTNGRAAWNVVTSMNDVEAQNMGLDEAIDHDARYDRADEFMEVVHGHWDTWADDALIVDKATGRFADPDKVRRIDHKGAHFRSRGPFTVPRSPQGHPVVIQAGQSGRGRRFAARWGELIFTSNPDPSRRGRPTRSSRPTPPSLGRDPEQMKIATLCHPVVAATKAEAEDKFALIESLPLEVDSLMLLSENTNFDFGSKPLDEPFTDAELARFTRHAVGTRPGASQRSATASRRRATSSPSPGAASCNHPGSAAPRRSPTCSRSGSRRRPATASSSVPPACPAATRISLLSLCRSCSGAGCSRRTTRARRCRENLGLPRPVVARA